MYTRWEAFGAYCDFRDRGLRREALRQLNAFIASIENASFSERKEFVSWLLADSPDTQALPHPLKTRVVLPLLEEWITREPTNSTPHFWFGTIPHLWEAYRLDSSNVAIARALITKVLHAIQYEMHELPYGFVGDDPDGCIADLLRLHHILSFLPASPDISRIGQEIGDRIEVMSNFLAYLRDSDRDASDRFADWCTRTGRRGR